MHIPRVYIYAVARLVFRNDSYVSYVRISGAANDLAKFERKFPPCSPVKTYRRLMFTYNLRVCVYGERVSARINTARLKGPIATFAVVINAP